MPDYGLTPRELRRFHALKTPEKIQRYLDSLPYHVAGTAWSPKKVLAEGTAHCLEGAIFAAAALRVNGYPPLLLDFEAVRDTDHVIAIYKVRNCWGAIGKSNFSGLRFREPVYRSLRELAMSYFEDYYNLRGERTLRAFSNPVDLSRFDRLNWIATDKPVWFVPEHLCVISHAPLISEGQARRLSLKDARSRAAGLVGSVSH